MELTYEQALNRAAAYCSKSEHCVSEVMRKVQDWGRPEADARKIVDWLKQERFLDEARYVHAFVNDKHCYAHWGRVKIAYALRAKHLPEALINKALDEVIGADDYLEALVELLRVKTRRMEQPLSLNDRAKVYRYAAQKGYEAGLVSKALAQLKIREADDEC